MKLTGRDAQAYLRRPDPAHAAILLFGSDAMRVALKRKDVVSALVGPEGEAEMRLTRLPAADLRKDSAALLDAVKAQGFFPGHRVVLVEDATDGLAPLVQTVLSDWRAGDAQIVLTAGQLTAKSALRKLLEKAPGSVAIGLYDDPPGRDEVLSLLSTAGLGEPPRDAMEALTALAHGLPPGDFRQTIEKLGLYKRGDSSPLSPADIDAVAPAALDVDLDEVLDVIAAGETGKVGPALRGLTAQGVAPVTLCIGATRYFRRLHQVASDPGGAAAGVGRLRPPVFGPRRDRLVRTASDWGRDRLERALATLTDTDLQLRSASTAPQQALMERALIRLAMMPRAR